MSKSYEREVKHFLGPKGPLAGLVPNYECRPEQADMAAAVIRALAGHSIAIVEAGTGTGKTLAYLVPAIYAGERVIISTGTKALQEQLINKDLPILAREFDIRAALMKGRTNYLCWKRYYEFNRDPSFKFKNEINYYDIIMKWAENTATGDRAEIGGLPDNFSAWKEMTASGEQCTGQKCEFYDDCFVTIMRGMAQQADIVVVNHHLFFADLAIRASAQSSILPDYRTVILDEAHGLAETATEYFGVQVSTWRLADLGQDVRRMQSAGQMEVDTLRKILQALERAEFAAQNVFQAVAERMKGGSFNGEGGRMSLQPLKGDGFILEELEKARADLKFLSNTLEKVSSGDDDYCGGLAERAHALSAELGFVLAQEDPDHVYWAEVKNKGVILRASPAELGPILDEKLYTDDKPLIFTSATLAVKKKNDWSFEHFKTEMGLSDVTRKVEEVYLPSSYEWKEKAVLYVPKHLPEPTSNDFILEASREMFRLLKISGGRAFLLFTSYRNLEAAYENLAPHLPYPVLRQGEAPKSDLLEEFREDEESVLFATHSFWEGVDVSGRSLSCVIVDKLPFASPGDPLMSARIERIRKKGGNPFQDYQLPRAVIALKQGLGRLIRTREDYGILAVLDGRLYKKNYGRTFFNSLPPAPLTHDIRDVESFFARHDRGD